MNNYIYIDGKKIEISEETANNLKEKFSEKSPYEFEEGDEYYILNRVGEISSSIWDDYYIEVDIKKQGNAFRTKKEAEHERDKRKAIHKIKKYIYDNLGYDPTDWAEWLNKEEKKYIIYLDQYSGLDIFYKYFSKYYSPIGYLKTEDQAQEIIDNFEDELKIIFDI